MAFINGKDKVNDDARVYATRKEFDQENKIKELTRQRDFFKNSFNRKSSLLSRSMKILDRQNDLLRNIESVLTSCVGKDIPDVMRLVEIKEAIEEFQKNSGDLE